MIPCLRSFVARLRAKKGRRVRLKRGVVLGGRCAFEGYNTVFDGAILIDCELGFASYVGVRCNLNRVKVGKYSCIGPNVIAAVGMHPARQSVSIHPAFFSASNSIKHSYVEKQLFAEHKNLGGSGASILVGNDVWIGAGVVILEGVTIGDGAVIGAGTVVHKDVAPYSIVCGQGMRVIGERFPEDVAGKIQASRWWDLEPEELKAIAMSFSDPVAFLSTARIAGGADR